MKLKRRLALCCLALVASSGAFARDDANETAIKARSSDMQLRSFYAGQLFAMAKGKMPYDAAKAVKLTSSLKLLSELDNSGFWPMGSDVSAYPEKTSAKKEIWTTYPEIGKYAKKYQQAITGLESEAGNGLGALRSTIGALGKSCKGCHDEYKQED